ncbi:MAG: hypothetical protein AB7T59_04005 [Hyphomonadaceae bacterium]
MRMRMARRYFFGAASGFLGAFRRARLSLSAAASRAWRFDAGFCFSFTTRIDPRFGPG